MSFHGCPIEPGDWSDGPYDEPLGEECHECNGTGKIIDDRDGEHTCRECDGTGYLPYDPYDDGDF